MVNAGVIGPKDIGVPTETGVPGNTPTPGNIKGGHDMTVSAYSHDMTTLRSRSFHLEGDRPQPNDLCLEPRY